MKPYWKQDNNIIYQGHVLGILKAMDEESVQMCVTSPPYWGLRDYGLPPMIWDGDENCRHEWGDNLRTSKGGKGQQKGITNNKKYVEASWDTAQELNQGQFCRLCNAWRGSLGLEPTPELFIEHIVQIFREVKRVLRKDGTVWLNLGDSYASGKGSCFNPGGGENSLEGHAKLKEHGAYKLNRPNVSDLESMGLKSKDLIGIPWRVALALQADGWWLRSDIIWSKPNPMPESVTDRPTKSHEYLFLLSKSPKYYYDTDAIREKADYDGRKDTKMKGSVKYESDEYLAEGKTNTLASQGHERWPHQINGNPARNKRTVWSIATQPMPEAHFATFPEKLLSPVFWPEHQRRAVAWSADRRGKG